MKTKSFSLSIKEFADTVKANHAEVVGKVAFEVFGAIIKRTPRDTGLAKGNWQISLGYPVYTGIHRFGGGFGEFDAEQQEEAVKIIELLRSGSNEVIYITNNVKYIMPLENGHSKQAIEGMVAVTLSEWKAYLAHAVELVNNG